VCIKIPTFEEMSLEQDLVYNLPTKGRFLISGPPGTGKSIVALHRASRIFADETMHVRGKSHVVLVMYSKLLHLWTSSAISASGSEIQESTIGSFHKWFEGWYQLAIGQNVPKIENPNSAVINHKSDAQSAFREFDWQKITDRVLEAEEDLLPIHKFDLIIDEGQDLPPDFYQLTNIIARSVTVFADDNQRLTELNTQTENIREYASIPEENSFLLQKNYRNSVEVAKVAERFYVGLSSGIPNLPERRSGIDPSLHSFPERKDQWSFIARYLDNNPTKQIGVFLPNYHLADELQDFVTKSSKANSQIYRNEFGKIQEVDPCRPGLLITYIGNSKGLEFDSVFVPSLEKWHHQIDFETKMKLYVLASRSRQDLHFSWAGTGEPAVLSVFPLDLLPIKRH